MKFIGGAYESHTQLVHVRPLLTHGGCDLIKKQTNANQGGGGHFGAA